MNEELKKEAQNIWDIFFKIGARIGKKEYDQVLSIIDRKVYNRATLLERKRWEGVRQAWLNEGPAPKYHHHMKELLKVKWPTLYYAIAQAIESNPEGGRE